MLQGLHKDHAKGPGKFNAAQVAAAAAALFPTGARATDAAFASDIVRKFVYGVLHAVAAILPDITWAYQVGLM